MGVHSFKEAAEAFNLQLPEKNRYIDSHCHYESKKFAKNQNEILEKVSKCCEKVICVGTNTRENADIMKLCNEHDFIYGMTGYFPTFVFKLEKSLCADADKNIQVMLEQLDMPKCVGLGEIGLDYSWNSVGDIKGDDARKLQKKWFVEQANIAIQKNVPVSIHSRDAEEDTLAIMAGLKGLKGVVHCFSYSPYAAKFFVDMGLFLGIGGTSTYKANDNIRQAIKETPLTRILLETDAPYLSPEPVRRALNDSSNIKYVIENIAKIKGISYEEVVTVTNNNCKLLYNF